MNPNNDIHQMLTAGKFGYQRSSGRRHSSRLASNDSGYSDHPNDSSPSGQLYSVVHSFTATKDDELDLVVGTIIERTDCAVNREGCIEGKIDGKRGFFPADHVVEIKREELLYRYEAHEIVHLDNEQGEHSFLGDGATAVVYKVKIVAAKTSENEFESSDQDDGQVIALKKFKEGFGRKDGKPYTKETAVKELRKEALFMNSVSHKNIVKLIGYCTDDSFFGLLLEMCHGKSLKNLCSNLDSNKPMPLTVLINWAGQIAEGMEHLTRIIMHRDLKADNVLIKQIPCRCDLNIDHCSECGGWGLSKLQLKIADFGVSKRMVTRNEMSAVGTYSWLAPEAFKSRKYSEYSDVWSYGVVLWEMLTRDVPYKGFVPVAAALSVANNGSSLAIDKHCPLEWKKVMMQCWAFEPKLRPKFAVLVQYFKDYAIEVREKHIIIPCFANEVETIYETRRGPNSEAYKAYQRYYGLDKMNRNVFSRNVSTLIENTSEIFSNITKSARTAISPLFGKTQRRNDRRRASLSPTGNNFRSRPKSSGDYPDDTIPRQPTSYASENDLDDNDPNYEAISCLQDEPPSIMAPKLPHFFENLDYCTQNDIISDKFVINPAYFGHLAKKTTIEIPDIGKSEAKEEEELLAEEKAESSIRIEDPITSESYSVEVPGRYTELKFVEKNDQGIVFSSLDNVTRENVKIAKIEWFDEEGQSNIKDLYREIAILALIKHPYIAPLLGFFNSTASGESPNATYLVKKQAETLRDALLNEKIKKSVGHRDLSYFLYQMLCAVKHLHDSGLVHQHLNSSNIIINEENILQIQDFWHSDSFHYRAPEEFFEDQPKSNKVDIWSIGCIFAEMYTHSILFPGKSRSEQCGTIYSTLNIPSRIFFIQLFGLSDAGKQVVRKPLAQIMEAHPHKEHSTFNSTNACDLLSKMLKINPSQRISAEDALQHPYVETWFTEDEVNCPSVEIHLELDLSNKTKEEAGELFVQKLEQFNSLDHRMVPR